MHRPRVRSTGAGYWRSLEEHAGSEEFQRALEREFPGGLPEGLDRRRFLKLMSASLALAGLAGCATQPPEYIVPYVQSPEQVVPGRPLYFATAFEVAGYALGVVGESHLGRPTKIEGNPNHPASLGATDALAQASVLTLYDPDRSRVVTRLGQISSWDAFQSEIALEMERSRTEGPGRVRLLTGTVSSPTLAAEIRRFRNAFPEAGWHRWEPFGRHGAKAGSRMAFGRYLETRYRFDQARVVVSLGADLFGAFPGSVRYARDLVGARRAAGRQAQELAADINRLWVIESSPTITGATADVRLAVRPSDIPALTAAIAARLGLGAGQTLPPRLAEVEGRLDGLAEDLLANRSRSVVVAGEEAPPAVHAACHAINEALGNFGETVVHTEPVEAEPEDDVESLGRLTEDMNSGRVDTLVVMGANNPVLTAPADMAFAEALARVRVRIHHGLYHDETAEHCQWHVPDLHYLESWADTRGFDGVVSIVQPLIQPLYQGRSPYEVLAALASGPRRPPLEVVRQFWAGQYEGDAFERFWERALSDGVVEGTGLGPVEAGISVAFPPDLGAEPEDDRTLELTLRADSAVFDGRFSNNGWLQEMPRPITKLTWSNGVLVGPGTASRIGLEPGDEVELSAGDRAVTGSVWVQPGQAEDTITLHVGYGRWRSGRVGDGVGFDAYPLRVSDALHRRSGVAIRRTGRSLPLVSTQVHHSMLGRDFVREVALEEYLADPDSVRLPDPPGESLYPDYPEDEYEWGMAIDIGACTGCSACVIACQAENNIPIVGPEQVAMGREMHWLRVDSYYRGDPAAPEILHQPVPCMHCENAPCEPVCPVGATVHDREGLNVMVYNRCVGTRYCSNNCPYKVRRFNFLSYTGSDNPPTLGANPDVTVRARGVMEKCTYCVQRIAGARIEAGREDRPIRDGEVVTACQGACPTEAIVFGDVTDPDSRVSQLKRSPLNYPLLGELNTRPRTTYLARIRNRVEPRPPVEE